MHGMHLSGMRSGVLALVVTIAGILVGGCAGNRAGPNGDASYVEQYARGDYARAKATALAAADRSSGLERDRANLIAGIAAAELHENAEATRLLQPLADHRDAEIAGRAAAGLGVVARSQGDRSRAAALFVDAGRKLSGDPAAKACMAAGDTFAELGARDQATSQYTAGLAAARSADLKAQLDQRLEGKRYTVQLGVFSTRANASRKAAQCRSRCRSLGLGEPAIAPATIRGQPSYLVQVGDFATKQEAKLASIKVGGGSMVAETELK